MKSPQYDEYMLFIYQVEGKRGFLVYDGRQYARFLVVGGKYRFVRAQRAISAGASGCCASVTANERDLLTREATCYGVKVRFFTTANACLQDAVEQRHEQYIYGLSAPGGYFLLDSAFRG